MSINPATATRCCNRLSSLRRLLRENGFSVAPEQTMGFVEAVGLLGPRDMNDILRAGRAMFAPPPERRPEFDALFRMKFLGQSIPVPASGPDEDEIIGR